jgi:hypothetical protein
VNFEISLGLPSYKRMTAEAHQKIDDQNHPDYQKENLPNREHDSRNPHLLEYVISKPPDQSEAQGEDKDHEDPMNEAAT